VGLIKLRPARAIVEDCFDAAGLDEIRPAAERNEILEAQAGKPAPGQMHAQFLHQFAFAGDANRMRSSFDF
jgi:hypothetical protein